jgi:hypothetical protein
MGDPSIATLVAINPTDAGGYVAHVLFSSSPPNGLNGFTLKYGASTIPSSYYLITKSLIYTQGEELPDEFGYMVYFNTAVAISESEPVSVLWNTTLGESGPKAMGPLLKRPTIKAMYNDDTFEELSIGITVDDHAISTPFLLHTYTVATVGGVTTYTRQPYLSGMSTGPGGNDPVAASTTCITRLSSFISHINNFIDDTVSSISGDTLKVNYVEQNVNFAFVVESADGAFRLVTPEQKITPLPDLRIQLQAHSNGLRLQNNIADPQYALQHYTYAMPPGRRDYEIRGIHFIPFGSLELSGRNGAMSFDFYYAREYNYAGVIPSEEDSDYFAISLLSTDGIARRSSNINFTYTPMDTPAVAAIAAGPTAAGSIAAAAVALAEALGPTVVQVIMDISGEGVKSFAEGVDPSKYFNTPVSVISVTNGGTISFTEETLGTTVIFPSSAELTNYTVTVSETTYAISFDASGTMSINGSPVLLGSFFMLGNRARYVFAIGSAMIEDGIDPPTVTTTTTSNSVTISWIDGSSGDFVIDGYQIVVSYDGSDTTYDIPDGVSSHTISNLSNGSYGVTVSMKSGNLVGIASDSEAFTIGGGGGGNIPCFLAGAPILTPSGYQRIETLTEGDMVTTSDGRSVAIQRVKRTLVTAGPSVDPYVIPKGRFGATRRLLISPNHKVQTDEGSGMVEAKDLGLQQEAQSGQFIYYNLELPSWSTDKMVVAGVTVESLAPVRRIAMPLATLKALVAKQYGTSSAHLERVLRASSFLPNGLIEIPMMRK